MAMDTAIEPPAPGAQQPRFDFWEEVPITPTQRRRNTSALRRANERAESQLRTLRGPPPPKPVPRQPSPWRRRLKLSARKAYALMWREIWGIPAAGLRSLGKWLFIALLTSLGFWNFRDDIVAWFKGLMVPPAIEVPANGKPVEGSKNKSPIAPPAIEAPANGKPDDGWEKGTVVQPELPTNRP